MSAQNFDAEKIAAAFPVIEAQLPASLGVSRKMLALIRQEVLTKDVDWRIVEKEVRLTNSAVERIVGAYGALKKTTASKAAEALQTTDAEPAKAGTPNLANVAVIEGQAPARAEILELVVLGICKTNRKMIFAAGPQGRVAVRVQENRWWRPQMVVRARQVHGEVWERLGRDPRWQGDTP